MAITVKGIRVEFVSIEHQAETGRFTIKDARYSLISSTEHVLASSSIGGYGGLTLKPSTETLKLLEAFMLSYKNDVLAVLGLDLS
jgi:hypothetical protein